MTFRMLTAFQFLGFSYVLAPPHRNWCWRDLGNLVDTPRSRNCPPMVDQILMDRCEMGVVWTTAGGQNAIART